MYQTGEQQVASEINEKFLLDTKVGVRDGYLTMEPSVDGKYTIINLIPQPGGGIFMPIKDAMFPYKGAPTAGVVHNANMIKAVFMEFVKILSKWYIAPALLLMNKQILIDAINRIGMKILSPFIVKDYILTSFSSESLRMAQTFLTESGFTKESSETFARLFVNMIDYDNAYRLRLEDTMSLTTKEKLLANPSKEIKRLTKIMASREVRPAGKGKAIHRKFSRVAFLIRLALLVPKYRKAFKKAIRQSEFHRLQLDVIDSYWVAFRNDYKWLGMTDQERKDWASRKGWTYPEPVKE